MNNSLFEIEKNEKHEDNPKISLFSLQLNEKENDSLDNNEYLARDTISFDKFLEIKTKANSNDGKSFKRKKLDENLLFLYSGENNNNSLLNHSNYLKLENPFYNNYDSNIPKCGRKRKRPIDDKNIKVHNKYSDDNIRRRCKHLVLNNILDFINKQIILQYKGKIGNGIRKKKLYIINQSQKTDATINFNKNFLNKALKDIFSEPISSRYTDLPSNQNKIIIDILLNEKDENIRKYFNELFNINFSQCLSHFRGETYIKQLEGLKCFNDIKKKFLNKYEDGKDYVKVLEHYLNNYEKITERKKARSSRKTKEE